MKFCLWLISFISGWDTNFVLVQPRFFLEKFSQWIKDHWIKLNIFLGICHHPPCCTPEFFWFHLSNFFSLLLVEAWTPCLWLNLASWAFRNTWNLNFWRCQCSTVTGKSLVFVVFCCCCTADSQPDEDRNQLNNNLKINELDIFASDSLGSEFLALKQESRIIGHSSNPVCGFSMMELVRLCAVWPTENWLGSSLYQIRGWTTVRESYSPALEQGSLAGMQHFLTPTSALRSTSDAESRLRSFFFVSGFEEEDDIVRQNNEDSETKLSREMFPDMRHFTAKRMKLLLVVYFCKGVQVQGDSR